MLMIEKCNSFLRVKEFCVFFLFFITKISPLGTFIDFSTWQATGPTSIPLQNGTWEYTTSITNPKPSCGTITGNSQATFCKTIPYNSNTHDMISLYSPGYNSDHMGWENFGYLEISDKTYVYENSKSLKYVVTGGKNNDNIDGCGMTLTNKEDYIENLNSHGITNVICNTNEKIGCPYLYFKNTGVDHTHPFESSPSSNRLSFYFKMPSDVTIGNGGSGNPPRSTLTVGPYNEIGGHWYNHYNINGGDWTHVIVDGHPQHNNAFHSEDSWPFPSRSCRSYGYDYFTNMFRFYVAFHPYSGISVPPFAVYFEKFEFIEDTEPRNEETIAGLAVMFKRNEKIFEISFQDKYVNNAHSNSIYEIRYSLSNPITNANFHLCDPVIILPHTGFEISHRTDGLVQKYWPYYKNVWASFRLSNNSEIENTFIKGTRIYFGIKDVSQVGGNGMVPISIPLNGRENGGRDYENYNSTFDYEGDSVVLNLINRIDFIIPYDDGTDEVVGPQGIGLLEIIISVIVGCLIFFIFCVVLIGVFVGIMFISFGMKRKKMEESKMKMDIEISKIHE